VGSGACIVTAGRLGSIIMWPEVELRSVAEAVGFVLPTRSPVIAGDGKRVSISQASQPFAFPQRKCPCRCLSAGPPDIIMIDAVLLPSSATLNLGNAFPWEHRARSQ